MMQAPCWCTRTIDVSIKGKTVQTVFVDVNTGQVVKILPADTEAETNNEQNGQESGD